MKKRSLIAVLSALNLRTTMKTCAVKTCTKEIMPETHPHTPFGEVCEAHWHSWATRFGGEVREEYVVPLRPAFSDERGDIINVFNGDLEHVALITCAAGSTRANHYHPLGNTQLMFCVSGRYVASSQEVNPETGLLVVGTLQTQLIRAGDLHEAPALLGHRYDFLEPSVFLNLNTKLRHADGYGRHTLPITLPAPDLTLFR